MHGRFKKIIILKIYIHFLSQFIKILRVCMLEKRIYQEALILMKFMFMLITTELMKITGKEMFL